MLGRYKIIIFVITLFTFCFFKQAESFSIANFKHGTITEKNTGAPIEGVILVRSWDTVSASPGGPVNQFLTLQETITDKKGRYNFAPKLLSQVEIPILVGIEENNPIAYKPGYKFVTFAPKISNIQMEKIPSTYYLRYEECNKVKETYRPDFFETKILKEAIQKEETTIKNLPRYVPGVFYQGFTFEKDHLHSPGDIYLDAEDNIYIADGGVPSMIQKISNKGEIIDKEIVSFRGIVLGRSNVLSKNFDIENDDKGNLFIYGEQTLLKKIIMDNGYDDKGNRFIYPKQTSQKKIKNYIYKIILGGRGDINFFPFYDMRIVIGPMNTLFLIRADASFSNTPVIYSCDFDGNLLCQREMVDENIKPDEVNTQLIDLTTDNRGDILLVYSYFNSHWDNAKRAYIYRNGIFKLDHNCNLIYNKELSLDGRVTSITTTLDNYIIISDSHCFYVYDKNLNLQYKYDLSNRELGEISIKRIKADLRGENLYIIEGQYGRILKYNLNDKKLCEKK